MSKKMNKTAAELLQELKEQAERGEVSAAEFAGRLADIVDVTTEEERKAAEKDEKRRAWYENTLKELEKMEQRGVALVEKVKAGKATAEERRELLGLINWAFHKSGKIQGIYSLDGCAVCEFCQKMIKAAEENPLMICGYCYAFADLWKKFVLIRHRLNMVILSSVLFTAEELRASMTAAGIDPAGVRFLRINEDGDTVNEIHARNNLRAAEVLRPYGGRVGYFFKNAAAVDKGLKAEGITRREDLPGNVVFVQSSILIGFESRPTWFADIVFTVHPDQETTETAIKGGAFECNGRKCMNCGYNCYMKKRAEEVQQVAEVLRASKSNRAKILQAYKEEQARRAAVAV